MTVTSIEIHRLNEQGEFGWAVAREDGGCEKGVSPTLRDAMASAAACIGELEAEAGLWLEQPSEVQSDP
ncbi:MAG: hypothetical protein AAFQ73_02550 [Pseudomonadota bacterium]